MERTQMANQLKQYDVVITTYGVVTAEWPVTKKKGKERTFFRKMNKSVDRDVNGARNILLFALARCLKYLVDREPLPSVADIEELDPPPPKPPPPPVSSKRKPSASDKLTGTSKKMRRDKVKIPLEAAGFQSDGKLSKVPWAPPSIRIYAGWLLRVPLRTRREVLLIFCLTWWFSSRSRFGILKGAVSMEEAEGVGEGDRLERLQEAEDVSEEE
ncbi:hypothetical protein HDV05_008055 [Chytridiales sp. JEL 0842]|nr:hypothetical protein HDV05_008055 [Chytridiales sp. JEL 0842]